MDQRLVDWLLSENDKSSPEEMSSFLEMLKSHPAKVLGIFSQNMHGWAIQCLMDLKIDLDCSNSREECEQLLEAFQKHYAKQLVEMDVPKKPMDERFKKWIVEQYDLFTKFEMGIFLRMLKNSPRKIIIDIPRLAHKCSTELRIDILYNDTGAEREEVLMALKEHFALQLAEIS